jgi:hypothetical protein
MRLVEPSPAPKPHPLQVQSPNLVLGMKKTLYSELKTMCLELKLLKGFEITGSWERKKTERTILSPMLG